LCDVPLICAISQSKRTILLNFVKVGIELLWTPLALIYFGGSGALPNRMWLSKSNRRVRWSPVSITGRPKGNIDAVHREWAYSGEPKQLLIVRVP